MKKFLFAVLAAACLLCGGCGGLGGTMTADFTRGASDAFTCSDGWSNGGVFGCSWKESAVSFDGEGLTLTLSGAGDAVTSGEYRSRGFYGYGTYTVVMKPVKNPGVCTGFFTYTGPSDKNPQDEIDIEFLGCDTTKVQFNYYTAGEGGHEFLYELGFDASEGYHTYGFTWMMDAITWYVDGEAVYTATENLPTTPGRIMLNLWNGVGLEDWLGAYDGNAPLTASFRGVSYIEP